MNDYETLWENPFFTGPLTPEIALNYFADSVFYDPENNNVKFAQQWALNLLPYPSHLAPYYSHINNLFYNGELMKHQTGLEYDVFFNNSATDPIYVIVKQTRLDVQHTSIHNVYYIIKKVIYEVPDLKTLSDHRLSHSIFQCVDFYQSLLQLQSLSSQQTSDSSQPISDSNPTTQEQSLKESPKRKIAHFTSSAAFKQKSINAQTQCSILEARPLPTNLSESCLSYVFNEFKLLPSNQ